MVHVVVDLSRQLGNELAGHTRASGASRGMKKLIAEHDSALAPLSLTESNERNASILIEAPDSERANRIAAKLRSVQGVLAAYVKPMAEPP